MPNDPGIDIPSPRTFGFPFDSWRPGQWELVRQILEGDHRHNLLVAPTGFGKSLLYVAVGQLAGGRTMILTSTKALQDQLVRDFGDMGLYDVRGKNAYECTLPVLQPHLAHMVRRGSTAASAPCSWGFQCPLKESGGCPYYDRVRLAKDRELVVTNYDFWLYNPDFPRVDTLIMDEAHQAPGELSDYLSMRIDNKCRQYFAGRLPQTEEVEHWRDWGRWARQTIKQKLERYHSNPPSELMELARALDKFDWLQKGEWVVEIMPDGSVQFDCIKPEEFGALLWGRSDRTLMVSATANSMTAKAIGITDAHLWSAPSAFPVDRRKVWVIDGAVQVNFRMEEAHKRMWVSLIDRIIGSRCDRKGIVHTTSFERAKYLQTYSRYSSRLLLNESGTTRECVTRFLASKSPLVLVSPSVTTGYDFPYDACEFQVIGKIPFPDLRGKANKVRANLNKEWAGYMAAQVMVQASGRGMRAEDDLCETFIVDGSFSWWWPKHRKFTPLWWQEAVEWVSIGKLPDPPPKLERRN
jgi:ATP-dependent DNA helicase DinG